MKKKNNLRTKWDYTSLAKDYDNRADYSKILIKEILKKIKCKENYSVAEIGAGTGKLTKEIVKKKLIIKAVEPNEAMRKIGVKNINKIKKNNVTWIAGTGEKNSLENNSYYAVFFGSSFNVVNYEKIFKEIRRILIKDGYFCCMWNHRYLKNNLQKSIEKIIFNEIPNYSYGDRRLNYYRFLKSKPFFKNVKKLSKKFYFEVSKKSFIKAWYSHGTLRKNCKNSKQFKAIINKISELVNNSSKNKSIKIPYNTVAYIAQII